MNFIKEANMFEVKKLGRHLGAEISGFLLLVCGGDTNHHHS